MLRDILDTGRRTGSSKNTQPWDLIVVRNRDTLRALSKCGAFAGHLAGATLGLALVMHGDDAWTCMDEGRLIQNLMLAAWAHGVGTCIGSIYPQDNEQRARDLLDGGEDERWALCQQLRQLPGPRHQLAAGNDLFEPTQP